MKSRYIFKNILHVGHGGKLRISNGTIDYTLTDTDDANKTRIIISGYRRGLGSTGGIENMATTATGAHRFKLNNVTEEADIDYTDFTVYNSITTIGANYRRRIYSISNSNKFRGNIKSDYFITTEYFYNSLVIMA
jgi:hypothetical protein